MLTQLHTDEELLKSFAKGDERAFEVLYRRHKRRLWGMARKMGADLQQAEDILVEAMAAVAAQARRGRIRGSFIGYSLTAIHHRGLHVIERRNERDARAAVPIPRVLVGGGLSPEDAVLHKALRSEIEEALDALPGDMGLAVTLVDCQGLTYRETGEVLGCSEATVKRRLRDGRRLLALRLGHLRPGRVQLGETR